MSTSMLANVLMVCGAVLLAASSLLRDALPAPERLHPSLRADPVQTAVDLPPFSTRVGGIDYTVRPLYDYEIQGLVVSRHDTSAWWNWIHEANNDKLNVADLCVVFGENARTGAYRALHFSSGQFVCYAEAASDAAWRAFVPEALSNNHLLTDRNGFTRSLRGVRPGDQVRIRGYLAEYSHNHGLAFSRGTSTTRTDTGNGACETVYVKDLEILQRGGGPWRALFWVAWLLLGAGLAAWITAPLRLT
jgi:hypothetical protein